MPQIHDTDNYTVPGGIKLFFTPTGGVERDLGNMVDVAIGRETQELEHFTNRPGTRVKDKVLALSESITIDFALDEPVISNFILFFKGDTAAQQNSGTTAVVDQKVSLPTSYAMVSLGKPGAITSYSVRQFVDYCYLFDGVSTYTNNSTEADTSAGTPFTINADAGDFLYIGKTTKFQTFGIDVATSAVGYTGAKWEYWNGSAWTTLSTSGTADFSADGTVTFTIPGSWAQNTVNSITAYWLRFSQTAASPATPATVNSIGRSATIVENTDYVVDLGTSTSDARIRAVSGGKIADGEQIKVSYTYPTFTAVISNLVKAGAAEGAARLEVHPQSGRGLSFDIEIPKCQIASSGNLSLNDQEFMKIPLKLTVLDDTENTPTHPYGRIVVFDAIA
jgi:hypothetical protein